MPETPDGVRVTDARGRGLRLDAPPRRIVCLVPSITETLFALGAGESVVGVTEFCVHPAEARATRAVVGGTKNPRTEAIRALGPDLVIANREENRRRDVERLEAAGVRVLVTYARTVREAIEEIRSLGVLLGRGDRAEALARECEDALARAARVAPEPRPRAAALVWREPWMVVGADTFAHDLLAACGAENPFAARASRYPRIDLAELAAAAPEVLLLPTEPYAFGERDRDELLALDCPAARNGRVHVVEGELLSWYGPRIPRALATFSALMGPKA
jgi:ABC-type Fe3+-hydroxamate transport system substrate-binding protein